MDFCRCFSIYVFFLSFFFSKPFESLLQCVLMCIQSQFKIYGIFLKRVYILLSTLLYLSIFENICQLIDNIWIFNEDKMEWKNYHHSTPYTPSTFIEAMEFCCQKGSLQRHFIIWLYAIQSMWCSLCVYTIAILLLHFAISRGAFTLCTKVGTLEF